MASPDIHSTDTVLTPDSNQLSRSLGTSRRPYFQPRSSFHVGAITAVLKKIKSNLSPDLDHENGIVYALKDRNSSMTKVGFTKHTGLGRVQDVIHDCSVDIHKMYMHPPFYGAHRAEKIIHGLLAEWNHYRNDCTCKRLKNTEWFGKQFSEVMTMVQMVCDWMEREKPYHICANEECTVKNCRLKGILKREWYDALEIWNRTQFTQDPSEWAEFFLMHTAHLQPVQLMSPRSKATQMALRGFISLISSPASMLAATKDYMKDSLPIPQYDIPSEEQTHTRKANGGLQACDVCKSEFCLGQLEGYRCAEDYIDTFTHDTTGTSFPSTSKNVQQPISYNTPSKTISSYTERSGGQPSPSYFPIQNESPQSHRQVASLVKEYAALTNKLANILLSSPDTNRSYQPQHESSDDEEYLTATEWDGDETISATARSPTPASVHTTRKIPDDESRSRTSNHSHQNPGSTRNLGTKASPVIRRSPRPAAKRQSIS